MQVAPLVALFLRWTAQHRAPATCRFYTDRLKLFLKEYGARELGSLTALEVADFLIRAGAGQSDSTRRHNAVVLERFQAFALEHRVLERPLFGKLEKPRMGMRHRLPTDEETDRLLARATIEFRLIYAALRLCGARPGELCGAEIPDYDRSAGVIVRTEHKTARKTGRPRRLIVGKAFARLLDVAIGGRLDGPIFRAPSGRAWTVGNLSRTYSRLRDAAGLPRDLVLYLARHECGTRLTRTRGIEFARRMLGHASLSTTQRYVHLDERELAEAQDALPS